MASSHSIALSTQNVTLPQIPELFHPNFLDVLLPPNKTTSEDQIKVNPVELTNPMMKALVESNRTFTENMAPALSSTGSAVLDAFNSLNNKWSFGLVDKALRDSWSEDPAMTLRLIWNIRSIHDGKGEKELFYRSFGWLYENHPRTAISNLHMIVAHSCAAPKKQDPGRAHGYWKDLLNILALATCDELKLSTMARQANFLHNYTPPSKRRTRLSPKERKTPEQVKELQEKYRLRAKERRKELQNQFHERLFKKLTTDDKFRALYIAVARMFAQQIREDVAAMKELSGTDKQTDKERYWSLLKSISLAGKWAPSPSGSHDRVTNISTAICQLLFSPNENSGPNAITPLPSAAPYPIPTDRDNCLILRNFYHHWILKPLREVSACPEPLMSSNRWTEIQYTRIPSVCMSLNKGHFFLHDPEGFQDYLIGVESGKKTISGATLMPHELVMDAVKFQRQLEKAFDNKYPKLQEIRRNMAEQQLKVVNAQWRTLISRLRESGSMDNALAICDVSGSMGSIHDGSRKNVEPIFPSIGLSLVLASLAKPPFNAAFITFSSVPQVIRLDGLEERGLAEIVEEMSKADWDANTDFQAVFLKLLLPLAKKHNIPKEDMVKRLFVFSDMQFDAASGSYGTKPKDWDTNHDLVVKAYQEAGYDVPEIVYWNLNGERTRHTVEVDAERKGVAMMSGFSSAMMKVFMGEAEEGEEWAEVTKDGGVVEKMESQFNPLNIMKKALFKKSFDGLVVVD